MTKFRNRHDQLIRDGEFLREWFSNESEKLENDWHRLEDLPLDLENMRLAKAELHLREKHILRKSNRLNYMHTFLLWEYGILSAIENRIGLFYSNANEPKEKLTTKIPGSSARFVLRMIFPKKVFERVFAEPISDMQVEYIDALSKGNTPHAKWIVARGRMIILATVAYYLFSSTIGKLIRDLLKPTRMSD